MADVTYPFDQSGVASTNLVRNETHTTTEANFRDYRFIVPKFAPFFTNNLVVKHQAEDGTVTTLEHNKDYSEALPYVAAQRSLGKAVYGAITLSNEVANGLISVTYQTIGGTWVCDAQYVLEYLAEKAYNPRVTIWDNVTNVQDLFPVIDHYEPYDSIYGQDYLIESVNQIATAILGGEVSSDVTHSMRRDNPHAVTATQVGLGSVINAGMATLAQAAAGEETNAYINPVNLKYVLDGIRNNLTQVSEIVNGYVSNLVTHASGQDSHGLQEILTRLNELENNESGADQNLTQTLANLETKVSLLEQFKSDIAVTVSTNSDDINTLRSLVNGMSQQITEMISALEGTLTGDILVISDTAPAITDKSKFWYDSSEGDLLVNYNGVWVSSVAKIAANDLIIFSATEPSTSVDQIFWWNETTSNLYVKQTAATNVVSWASITPAVESISADDIVIISSTAPDVSGKQIFWWDNTEGQLYIKYTDENGTVAWMQANPTVSIPEQLTPADVIAISDTAPDVTGSELVWWDSDAGQLFVKYTDENDVVAWVQAIPTPAASSSGSGSVSTPTIIEVNSGMMIVSYNLINSARTNSSSMEIIFNVNPGRTVTIGDLTGCEGMTLKFRAYYKFGGDEGTCKVKLNSGIVYNDSDIYDLIQSDGIILNKSTGIFGSPGELELIVKTATACNIWTSGDVVAEMI